MCKELEMYTIIRMKAYITDSNLFQIKMPIKSWLVIWNITLNIILSWYPLYLKAMNTDWAATAINFSVFKKLLS